MNWLALLEDLLQIAAPIVAAHTQGKAAQIASAVDSVAPQLHAIAAATGNATVESVVGTATTVAAEIAPATTAA